LSWKPGRESGINPSPAHPQNLTANKKADGLCDQTIVEVISLSFSSSGKGCKLQKQQIVTCGPNFFPLIFYGKRSNLSMGIKFSQGNFPELLLL